KTRPAGSTPQTGSGAGGAGFHAQPVEDRLYALDAVTNHRSGVRSCGRHRNFRHSVFLFTLRAWAGKFHQTGAQATKAAVAACEPATPNFDSQALERCGPRNLGELLQP